MSPARKTSLMDHHANHLRDSAISAEVINERGYQSIRRDSNASNEMHDKLKSAGIPGWARRDNARYPGILIPLYRATGEHISWQYRPDSPPKVGDKERKYASQVGRASVLDVHPRNRDRAADPTVDLWITEGVKKGDALTTAGQCVVTLMGVFNWRSKMGTLGDWEDIPLKGRTVVVCFDADARTNRNVSRAMIRLGRWLKSKGTKTVEYLIVPDEMNGVSVKGADDYLAAGGSVEALRRAATTTEPDTDTMDGAFSDAYLVDSAVDDVLDGRFRWNAGLGWLEWDGRRWRERPEAAVVETVRLWAMDKFQEASEGLRTGSKQSSKEVVHGWLTVLNKGRLNAIVTLARGIESSIHTTAEDFDAHPDLLNTPDGVVDLRTGEVRPHDPDLLLTKTTSGSYRPGFTHPDWDKALRALPEDVRDWMQVRFGQAATGHTTPDGRMLVLQGGGENGKGAVTTDGIVPALGDYAAMASHKLFMAGKGSEHSTERADLRGQRLLIAEELTEGRSIDVTALKQICDVGRIKARKVHKDNLEFDASHSLFTTTNYIPVVNETDHGTWRRLTLVRFPYKFKGPGEPLQDSNERRGDPTLKGRIKANSGDQHDAIVTWVVDGAVRWYADQERLTAELAEAETDETKDVAASVMSPPPTVKADTLAWRTEADRVLGFWTERLVPDPGSCVLASELLEAFNDWLKDNGHQAWSKETFGPRFEGHEETTRHRVGRGVTAALQGLSRYLSPGSAWSDRPTPKQARVWKGVRFRTDLDADCQVCGQPLEARLAKAETGVHPGCTPQAAGTAETAADQGKLSQVDEVDNLAGNPPMRMSSKSFPEGCQPRQPGAPGPLPDGGCQVCKEPLDRALLASGAAAHPTCDPEGKAGGRVNGDPVIASMLPSLPLPAVELPRQGQPAAKCVTCLGPLGDERVGRGTAFEHPGCANNEARRQAALRESSKRFEAAASQPGEDDNPFA